ncbi:uncharacterized protein LOC131163659 isoform X1 [Malania oleifera]|uniref:uncharacterized protein LOC131163659 isoform X1 n=1 Tax=Malania oleifera TaxID=397392 RepID=UPI0025AE7346|nr:uncharacterized protein LOC131163659 isoform X1 [Malania oleifera]
MAVGQQAAAEAAKSSLSIFCVTLLLISTQLLIQSPTVLAAPPALVSSQQSIKEKVVFDNINSRKMHGGLKDNKGSRSAPDGCGALEAVGHGDAYNRARLGNPSTNAPGIRRGPCPPGSKPRHPRMHP